MTKEGWIKLLELVEFVGNIISMHNTSNRITITLEPVGPDKILSAVIRISVSTVSCIGRYVCPEVRLSPKGINYKEF